MNKQGLFIELLNTRTEEFLETLHKPVFKAMDIPLTNRIINHWHENDLFLYKKAPGEWRKFSVADYMWVLLCNKLRAWNVGLQTIKKVRSQCVESTHQMLLAGVHHTLNGMESGVVTDPALLSVLQMLKKPDALKEELAAPQFQMFSLWLSLCLEHDTDVLLRILPDENNTVDFVVLNKGKVDSEKLLIEMIQESAIFISMQSLLNEFYAESRFRWEEVIPLNLTSREKKVIGRLREKGLKSVKVIFKNDELDCLVVEQRPKTIRREEFNNNILKGNYRRVEVISEDNDKILLRIEQSVKLVG